MKPSRLGLRRQRKHRGAKQSEISEPSPRLPGENHLAQVTRATVSEPLTLAAVRELFAGGHEKRARAWLKKLLDLDRPRAPRHADLMRLAIEYALAAGEQASCADDLAWLATMPAHATFAHWHLAQVARDAATVQRHLELVVSRDIGYGAAWDRLRRDAWPGATWPDALHLPLGERYSILAVVGAGASSIVYRARDTRMDRSVAIKVWQRHERSTPSAEALREARAVASLRHPNILPLLDANLTSGHLVFELAHGTLADALADTRTENRAARSPATVVAWCRELLAGLAHIHGRGLLHRDIKPSNIFLRMRTAALAIGDFGLAIHDASASRAGTLAYAAPEQIAGRAEQASDLFAAGRVIGEIVAATNWSPAAADATRAQLTALVQRLTAVEPAARPTALQALADVEATQTEDVPSGVPPTR